MRRVLDVALHQRMAAVQADPLKAQEVIDLRLRRKRRAPIDAAEDLGVVRLKLFGPAGAWVVFAGAVAAIDMPVAECGEGSPEGDGIVEHPLPHPAEVRQTLERLRVLASLAQDR